MSKILPKTVKLCCTVPLFCECSYCCVALSTSCVMEVDALNGSANNVAVVRTYRSANNCIGYSRHLLTKTKIFVNENNSFSLTKTKTKI